VEPPNLGGDDPLGAFAGEGITVTKKFKLVLNQPSITPVEPITNLLNKRKEPEFPPDDDDLDIITGDGHEQEERHGSYNLSLISVH
jgi:hypothetical protein